MKKVPAIRIELNNGVYNCTSLAEYDLFKKHFKKTSQMILSEQLVIIDQPETMEELAK